ncbi:MAG: hypothetical protein H0X16_01385 [Chloroflexi bacterium]|nr:hypothetical protein [Chloroflexota bacterium]
MAVATRWWWTLVAATLVAAVAAYLVASQTTPTYAAEVKLLVGPISADADTLRAATQIANTYAELATSTPVLQRAADSSNSSDAPTDLRERVHATASEVTRIVTIRAEANDPELAARLANDVAAAVDEVVSVGNIGPEGRIRVVDAAVPVADPVAPRVAFIVALAAMAGFIGAVVLVMLVEHLSDAITDPGELERLSGLPMLAKVIVPRHRSQAQPPFVVAALGPSPGNTSYHLLTTRLVARDERFPRALLVTGLTRDDPSAEVSATLAATAAAYSARVAWIDVSGSEQLQGWLVRPASQPAMGAVATPLVFEDASATDLQGVREILRRLLEQADSIIVNAPASADSPAALTWASACERHLFVVEVRHATRLGLRHEIESLQSAGAQTAGLVLAQRSRSAGSGSVERALAKKVDTVGSREASDAAPPRR